MQIQTSKYDLYDVIRMKKERIDIDTVEPRFSERQPSGKPRYSGNFADDQFFI